MQSFRMAAAVEGTNWTVTGLPVGGGGLAEFAVEAVEGGVTNNPNATNAAPSDPGDLNPNAPDGTGMGATWARPAHVRMVSGEWEEEYHGSGEVYSGWEDEWGAVQIQSTRQWRWDERTGGEAEYFGSFSHPAWLVFPYTPDQWHTRYRLYPDGREELTAWEVWDGETYTHTNEASIKAWYGGHAFPRLRPRQTAAWCLTPSSMCSKAASRGGCCPKTSGLGRRSITSSVRGAWTALGPPPTRPCASVCAPPKAALRSPAPRSWTAKASSLTATGMKLAAMIEQIRDLDEEHATRHESQSP